ncbi:MAG: hypothetical protein JNL21_26110 [Myxococcales bacterium]|nr:hypothetical protein [Myxococcales bacterium]
MRRHAAPWVLSLALPLLFACSDDTTETEPEPTEPKPTVRYLAPTDHLVRASMVLRGKRPSLDELAAVEADPDAIEGIVDGYLASEDFGRTIRDLHNEALLLRPDWAYYPAGFPRVAPLTGYDQAKINGSVQEAPLKLIEHVVLNDRPYSEIVTADYTLADPIVATVWDLTYDPSGPEWQQTKWEDGRGNAGILTDSWLYVRWQSTPSNANRGRANALSRGLLCYDFLSRDVELDTSVNVADPNAVQSAVVGNPACASCHQALDPLASFMKDIYPITVVADTEQYPTYPSQNMWLPGAFETYLQIEMRQPAFFGRPGETLQDLGRFIAEDPRFSLCAAKRFYAYFNHVDLEAVPDERAAELQETFLDSGMNAKVLAKAVVLSDEFRVSHAASEDGADDVVGMRRARPDELAAMIEDLTGFVWATDLTTITSGDIGRIELPRDSILGYRVIGGGMDSQYVTQSGFTDSATTSLFLRAFAEEAASYVVEKDFAQPDRASRRLLTEVDEGATDEAAVRAQIAALFGRIFGELVDADSEEVSQALALWQSSLASSQSAKRAYKTLLTAMMQDVRVAYY